MSSSPNPFQSPNTNPYEQGGGYYAPPKPSAYVTPPPSRNSMSWGESISYVFNHPQAMMNLLFGSICQLIPVIGPLVFMGYQFETIVDLTCSQGATYRAFDWNRFSAYLKRGLWPFLVAMLIMVVLIPVLYISMIVFGLVIGGAAQALGPDAGGIVALIGMLFFMAFIFAFSIGLQMLLQPLMLRAALTQNFAEGFQLGFAVEFVKLTWKEMVVGFLFQGFMGMMIIIVGMLALCVGIYPAMVVVLLMQAHCQFQYYEIYRARGGSVIPIMSAD